jgi:hypothetical protein
MKAVGKFAENVLKTLVSGLNDVGDHKKVDQSGGAFMAVCVEFVGKCKLGDLFSVAHYYEQNGDLMRDPEMVFLRGADGRFYPTYFRQDGGLCIEQESADVEKGTFRPAMQAEHASFAGLWMKNIREQQHLF